MDRDGLVLALSVQPIVTPVFHIKAPAIAEVRRETNDGVQMGLVIE